MPLYSSTTFFSRPSFRARAVSLFTAILFLAVSANAFASERAETTVESEVIYQGFATASNDAPVSGNRQLVLRYVDDRGATLLRESFEEVQFDSKGRFQVTLGTGTVGDDAVFATVQEAFDAHPKLHFEVSIDGDAQHPLIGVLPAGHSLKSRLLMSSDRDAFEAHWKHYDKKNGATSLQSAILKPARGTDSLLSYDTLRRRPFELPMRGPVLSTPVRNLPAAVQQPVKEDRREVNPPRHETLFDEKGQRFGTTTRKVNDRLAGAASRSASRTPALNFEFAGVGNVTGVLPPDTEGTVGLNHYVHVVNSAFAVYDKSGNQLTSIANTNTLWSGFGGPCQTNNSGDAIFLYDEQADRYVLTQFAVASGNQSVCWAISQTGDPTGAYYLYEVVTPRFPDYYKVGVWPDADNNAYFFGTNSGAQGQYDVFAVDRANMLVGAAARPMQFFQNFVNLMMPADIDGPTGPPVGSPGIFYTFRDGGEPYFNSPPADSIDVWEFDVDWNTPSNTTFTLVDSLAPTPFNWTVCGFFVSNCLPQPGTSQGIDSASWWPMQRLVYRNFGTHETLIGSWTVDVLASGNRAAPRWFELRKTANDWSIYQESTYSPDSVNRWMSSIAMDGSGNIALGFSRGDGSNFPSIYYATRDATDPLGTLGSEELLFAGTGSQTNSAARWGDYASMELDPADDCTFWFTSEYLQTTSSANWLTRVGTFTVPGCGGPPVPGFTLACAPASLTIDQGDSDTSICTVTSINGFNDPVSLSCSGAGGIGCAFAPGSLTPPADGSITSTVTLSVPAGQSTGAYNFDVVGTSGADSRSSAVSIDVVPAGSNGPQDAVYNASLGAPACAVAGSSCDTGSLVVGRANLGPEPNQPNTLDVCNDGTAGSFQSDESNDRIVVSTLDGGNFTEGDTVEISATVFAWSTGSQDTLDLYYAADANNPSWTYITSIGTPNGGPNTLTAQYTLPAGGLQAVRAQFRYQSTQTPCASGTYNDRDDLVFAVETGATNTAPSASIASPASGGSAIVGSSVSFSGSASDAEDGNLSSSLTWTSSIDGAIGSGASFSTTTLSIGVHAITASVTDSGGLSGTDSITFTIDDVANTAPSVAITAPDDGSSATAGASVAFSGSASDNEDGNLSSSLSWSSSLDGALGSGASFSTTTLSVGTHTITASVTDSGGLSGSDAISLTITNPANTSPSVTITAPADGSTSTQGVQVSFAGSASDAEDGNISASLSWSSSLDGTIGAGASFSNSTLSVGTHTITASVSDSGGLSDSDVISITVSAPANTAPAVSITAPADGSSAAVGTSVSFAGNASDSEDGNLSSSLSWTSSLDGTIGSGSGFSTTGLSVGSHTITASVTDSGGLSDSDSISVTITPVTGGDPEIWMSFRSNTVVPGVGTVTDEDIVSYNSTTGVWTYQFDGSDVGLGSLEISGLAVLPDGDLLMSFTAAGTVGGLSVDDSDIVRFTPTSLGANTAGSFSLYFDGSDVGLTTNGEDIDGIAFDGGSLLISTLGSASANSISGVRDEDLIQFTGTTGSNTSGSFSFYFDGSDVGLANSSSEDIDAAALTSSGTLIFSTVGNFSVAGAAGADEDVAEFTGSFGNSTAGSFSLILDLSALGIATNEDIGSLYVVE